MVTESGRTGQFSPPFPTHSPPTPVSRTKIRKTHAIQPLLYAFIIKNGSSTKSAMDFGSLQRAFSRKSQLLEESPQTGRPRWFFELFCYVTKHTKTNGEKKDCGHYFNGVNMTGNEDIKQPDITKTFPCTCPCFIKTVTRK